MSITRLPNIVFKRWTEFKWSSAKYFAVIQLAGNGFAGDAGWTFDATSTSIRLLKDVKYVVWSHPSTITPTNYSLPCTFYSYGALPAGTANVARIVGDGIHVPAFNDFDRSDWSGFNPANGVVNYITFYDNTYYIDQDESLAFAYSIKESVSYADWNGVAVFDVNKSAKINLTFSSKWQWISLFLFTQKYFELFNFISYPYEGISFPIIPKKIPSGYPNSKLGVYYLDDSTFSTSMNMEEQGLSSLIIDFASIPYLKNNAVKTATIWPETGIYSIDSLRINSNSLGGRLYKPAEWQNITGTPPRLTSLGQMSDTPFIWETWTP